MGALFTYDLPAQNRLQGERIEQRRSDRNQFRNGPERGGRCKKAKSDIIVKCVVWQP